jgi:hypothetical protein
VCVCFRPIYGYHDKLVKFWKIQFYNPAVIRKWESIDIMFVDDVLLLVSKSITQNSIENNLNEMSTSVSDVHSNNSSFTVTSRTNVVTMLLTLLDCLMTWVLDLLRSFFSRAAELLLAGAVMNEEFQPHEAHVPYNLQVEQNICRTTSNRLPVVIEVFHRLQSLWNEFYSI